MSLFAQRSRWIGPYSLKDPALAELFGSGSKTLAGPVVNELVAFTCAAFYDGVNQISSDVAKLPLNLKKRRQGGGSDDFTDSKTYKLLKYSPNPETRSLVFRRTMTMHALVYGNGYAEIVRDQVGRPAALWVMHPNQVMPFYDDGGNPAGRKPLRYRIHGQIVLEPRDVLHIQALGDDGVTGYNLVALAREALGLALASQQFASAFFGNGTRFGGVLSTDQQDIDEEQETEIRARIEKFHARADQAFRMLVLGMGFKFQPAGVNPNEAQMKEIRDQQVAEVARFLNMPLHKLKLNTPGAVSYASVEMADLDYYKGCLLNWITNWEEELNAKLIPALEIGQQFFKHNANAFLRGDIKSRYDALGVARDKGIINADEWRDLEDMNPQDGEQGKLYLVQQAQVPLAMIGDLTQSVIDKNNEPPPAPVAPGGGGGDRSAVEALERRAIAAEQLAAESREAYRQSSDAKALAEGAMATTCEEMAILRQQMESALSTATAHELIAAELRVELEHAKAALEAADAAREAATARATTAEAMATELNVVATDAAERLAAAESRESEMRDALAEAELTLTAATESAAVAQTERTLAEQRVVTLSAELTVANKAGQSLNEMAEMLAAAIARASEAESTAARLEAERLQAVDTVADIQAKATELTQAYQVAQDEARTRVEEAETTQTALTAERQAMAERAAIAEEGFTQLQQQHAARLTGVIGAHRALVVDVVRRLVERETDRAKSRLQSPEKLRGWMATFYVTFPDQFAEALVPALRVHLAWKGSTEDPMALATQMARAHSERSQAQLTAMLEATPEDLQVAVGHLFRQWERDRPEALADTLMADEIAHVRALGQAS